LTEASTSTSRSEFSVMFSRSILLMIDTVDVVLDRGRPSSGCTPHTRRPPAVSRWGWPLWPSPGSSRRDRVVCDGD
jgi:hypothetical protein